MLAPGVKICGLRRREDAEAAASAGALYGGVILAPGGKRTISPREVPALFEGLSLRRVGVFVDAPLADLRRDADFAGLHVLQLHGDEAPAFARELRDGGDLTVWKAVRVRVPDDLRQAIERYAGSVDALLLDGWSPDARGGTGTAFDWEDLAEQRSLLPETLGLVVAGGLNPANVSRAIRILRPDVVDVSSGVETAPGVKDPAAVRAFVEAATPL